MNHLIFEEFPCDDIVDSFGKKKIIDRYDTLFEEMKVFISSNKLDEFVKIDRLVLANIVIDYFSDIKRLKDFHTQIDKTNSEKVIAYTTYWLLRHKPIQIINHPPEMLKKLSTINERFALQYIFNYLSERECGTHILLRSNSGLKNFSKYMLYYLIYRLRDAQSLEMIITAFMAGQIYERTEEDISNFLHPYDVEEVE